MKLILTQDIANLGAPGDIVEVKDGYGRNFLVPRGFAVIATRGAAKQVADMKRARETREVRDLGSAREVAAQLSALEVKLPTRAGKEGRLFGSVTVADIAAAVEKAGGPKLDRRRIELTSPIKSTGTHRVRARLHPDVEATITLDVIPAQA